MEDNDIQNLPDEQLQDRHSDSGFTFHWLQLLIGAGICYYWFYQSWTSMLALALVVIIHELGHVVAGRTFGCRIDEMQVFLLCFASYKPKPKAGSWWRNITWSLGTLPLGGFTVFKSRPDDDRPDDDRPIDPAQAAASPYVTDKPAWQRLLISAGGVLFNFATFLIIYLLFHFPIGWSQILWRAMSMSLILAVLNILPVYPLDGGAIIFACYEMITGRKPSQQFVTACGAVGFILIILFFWVFPGWVHQILDRVFGLFF